MTDQFWFEMSHVDRDKLTALWRRVGVIQADFITNYDSAAAAIDGALKTERPRDQESWEPIREAFLQGWVDRNHEKLQTMKMDVR